MPFIKRSIKTHHIYLLFGIAVVLIMGLVYATKHSLSQISYEGFQEQQCVFVSSRGILKSCKHFNPNARSSETYTPIDIEAIRQNESVYICADALEDFAANILPRLKTEIVLVSGDADKTIQLSDAYAQTIIESSKVRRWFAQNLVDSHPKLVQMPIGLDYHTLSSNAGHFWGAQQSPLEQEAAIMSLQKLAKPIQERFPRIYGNFHFEITRGDRHEAYNEITSDLIEYQAEKSDRQTTHTNQMKYAFVASPFGVGLDCHRTWEALALGCIPIIKRSGLARLFEDMPVLVIDNWKDITRELLQSTIQRFADQQPFWKHPKMRLDYWMQQINTV